MIFKYKGVDATGKKIKEKIEALGVKVKEASLEMIPKTTVAVDGDTKASNEALIEFLEELDDVDVVFHNMEDS